MSRALKRLLRFFLGAAALVVVLVSACFLFTQVSAEARLRRTYDVQGSPVPVPTGEAAVERGRQLVIAGRCTECHGRDLRGQVTTDEPAVGQIYASNLTAGRGGVGAIYDDADWVLAIRHGIGQDGRSLVITPAKFYNRLSDEDLGAIIAYIKSVPPVDNEFPAPRVGPLSRVFLTLFNPCDWLPAEKIDHEAARPPAPPAGVTAEWGGYKFEISTCGACHELSDISPRPGGALETWDEADFVALMRRRIRPDSSFIEDNTMREIASELSDDDLRAIWLYLQTAEDEGRC
jgi:cytochrome c553